MQTTSCSRCGQLNSILVYLNRHEAVPVNGKSLLDLGKRSRRTNCAVCRFFLDLSPTYTKDYKLHVRLFDHIRPVPTLPPTLPTHTSLPRTRFLSVLRHNHKLQYDYSVQREVTQSGLIVYLPTGTSPNSVPVRSINALVDFRLLRSFLQRCKDSHSVCNQMKNRHDLSYIYLIDCLQERVVRQPALRSYLALSYVWGKPVPQTYPQTASCRGFPDTHFAFAEAPLTVQDAIRVVRELGMEYLWVDRYCINQTECPEKNLMLQNMDQIYTNAQATIVAMYGENDAAGLPGVSEVPRKPQSEFRLSHGRLVSSCPPLSTLVQRSTWATRGWTYQEARLSRRCLFFTEHQVYVTCSKSTASEAVPLEPQECWISRLLNCSGLRDVLSTELQLVGLGSCADRFAYSQRLLTYQSDVLNAFRGILSHSGFVTFWGVHVTPPNAAMDPNIGFAMGLLWTRKPTWAVSSHLQSFNERPRARRFGFPTWSWTSVTGEIYNEAYGGQSVLHKYLNSDAQVTILGDMNVRFSIVVGSEWVPLWRAMQCYPVALPEESSDLMIEGDLIRLSLIDGKYPYRVQGCEQLPFGFWPAYDLDKDKAIGLPRDKGISSFHDALILVDWHDVQKSNKKRFVMLLLKWVGNDRAERRGLLSEYRDEYDIEALDKIPRIRKNFVLQ